MCKSSGFSLIELLIVVLISGIALLATVLSIKNLAGSIRLKTTSAHVTAILERVSLEAVEARRDYSIAFSNGKVVVTSDNALKETLSLQKGISLASIKPKSTLQFYKSSVATPSVLTLTDGRKICAIVISLRGRIKNSCAIKVAAP